MSNRDCERDAPCDIPLRLVLAGGFTASFDRYLLAPLLIPIAQTFGCSLSAATAAASAYFIASSAAQLLFGAAVDRFGPARMLRFAYAGGAIAGMLSAMAPTLTAFVVARGAMGAMTAGVVAASIVYVGGSVAFDARQRVLVDFAAALGSAMAVASLVAGALASVLTWRLPIALAALASATLLLVSVARRRNDDRAHGASRTQGGVRAVVRAPGASTLIVLGIVEGAALQGGITFLAPSLQSVGHSPAVAGLTVTALGLTSMLASRIVKHAPRRPPDWALIVAGGLCLAAGYGVAATDREVLVMLAASGLCGAAYPLMHSAIQSWMLELVPHARGTATSIFGASLFAGSAVATGLLGVLASADHYGALYGATATLALVVTVGAACGRARFTPASAGTAPAA